MYTLLSWVEYMSGHSTYYIECIFTHSTQLNWMHQLYSTQLNWVERNAWVWVYRHIHYQTALDQHCSTCFYSCTHLRFKDNFEIQPEWISLKVSKFSIEVWIPFMWVWWNLVNHERFLSRIPFDDMWRRFTSVLSSPVSSSLEEAMYAWVYACLYFTKKSPFCRPVATLQIRLVKLWCWMISGLINGITHASIVVTFGRNQPFLDCKGKSIKEREAPKMLGMMQFLNLAPMPISRTITW